MKTMPRQHNAEIQFGRVTSNQEEDYIRLSMKDRASGRRVVVELSLEDFAFAITGRFSPCEMRVEEGKAPG